MQFTNLHAKIYAYDASHRVHRMFASNENRASANAPAKKKSARATKANTFAKSN